MRSAALDLLSTLPPAFLIPYIHPRLYAIHEMSDEAGLPGPDGIVMPPAMNLNSALFKTHGLYLIDDGQVQFLWVGRDAVPELVQDVFGLSSIDLVKAGKVCSFKHKADIDHSAIDGKCILSACQCCVGQIARYAYGELILSSSICCKGRRRSRIAYLGG